MASKKKQPAETVRPVPPPPQSSEFPTRRYKTRNTVNHDFDAEPLLEGVVCDRGKLPEKYESREFLTVDTGTSMRRVFRSKALEELFSVAAVGDGCRIQFLGTKVLEGNRVFRRFDASAWTVK